MPDEVQNLILAVQGEQKLVTLNAELAKEKAYLEQLLVTQKQGVVGVNQADIDKAARRMVDLNAEIAGLNKGVNQLSGRGGGQGPAGLRSDVPAGWRVVGSLLVRAPLLEQPGRRRARRAGDGLADVLGHSALNGCTASRQERRL
jgi:hypothetical protein